jgi:hypothetical protein
MALTSASDGSAELPIDAMHDDRVFQTGDRPSAVPIARCARGSPYMLGGIACEGSGRAYDPGDRTISYRAKGSLSNARGT